MMKRLIWLWMVGMVCILTGCRKELCYNHEEHTERIEYNLTLSYDVEWEYNLESHIDWEQYWNEDFGISYDDIRPKHPEGVRIHVYDEKDESEIVRNLATEGSSIYFTEEGHYSLLLHNNDTEYIVYEGMNFYSTAYATTRGVTRASYLGNSFLEGMQGPEMTVNPPDMLFGAYIDSIYVEKSTQAQKLNVTLHPLVFTYLIRYEIEEGAEYVALARGALAGMAKGVSLSNGRTSEEAATLLFDATVTGFGAQTLVKSFGVPDYPNPNYTRNSRQYGLNLEVRLKDGSYQQFDFDITEQMEKQPHGGVIVVKGIKVEKPEGGGAFDVEVEDWGDVIDIPLEL